MNILVCDDEPLARERLSRMVKVAGHEVVAQAANGFQALEQVRLHRPDVVLLDIRMPEMNGIQCAQALLDLEVPPAVIFVTAFDQHAIDAFNTQAIGYLLKPISQQQLENALKRASKLNSAQLKSLQQHATAGDSDDRPARKHIAARTHRGVELIPIENIYYFLADQKYVTVRHSGGQVLIDETLKELETEFPDRFIRIHRNALLAIPYLEGLEFVGTGQYQVRCRGINERLAVSRRHLPQLREKIHHI
ncbi:DNA-binding response regulator [Alkanindiges hydrocarboniclasticus]|jgi:two-component system response regulator AlgR|uniref:DNA-binding response regulator n=1 Tax=Alkanindiges hydrocarboniclasticus TaxID=1907941 RepID=A0A1S8CS90_9GAMM|nr:LytTR family DNA-binding domain-containing protein [Alkanindiges hydrocarboniclasticus]ONG38763.1 DNA-binding response regulator [Alkanindiges hydrocarboniclasticus]